MAHEASSVSLSSLFLPIRASVYGLLGLKLKTGCGVTHLKTFVFNFITELLG